MLGAQGTQRRQSARCGIDIGLAVHEVPGLHLARPLDHHVHRQRVVLALAGHEAGEVTHGEIG